MMSSKTEHNHLVSKVCSMIQRLDIILSICSALSQHIDKLATSSAACSWYIQYYNSALVPGHPRATSEATSTAWEVKEEVQELIRLKTKKKLIKQKIQQETVRVVLLKDLRNLASSLKSPAKNDLQDTVEMLQRDCSMSHTHLLGRPKSIPWMNKPWKQLGGHISTYM